MNTDTLKQYFDRDGFVKSHAAWEDAGNDGVILTVVAGLLGVVELGFVDKVVFACVDPKNGSLLLRPDNSGGHQSHDGWMSLATWLLFRGEAVLARGLLLSALTRGFYMKHHKFEFEGKTLWQKLDEIMKPAMWRYPRIWVTMLAAAYPNAVVLWLCSHLLRMLTLLSSVRPVDASGCQLQWIDHGALGLMGKLTSMSSFLKKFRDQGTTLTEVMSTPRPGPGDLPYWDKEHFVVAGFAHFEKMVLG
jgi:hypothetical protein